MQQRLIKYLSGTVCEPTRGCATFVREYDPARLYGGLAQKALFLGRDGVCVVVYRHDFTVKNSTTGDMIKASRFTLDVDSKRKIKTADDKEPAVVYCHCNVGNRLEAKEVVELMVEQGFTVFAFDFSGCGLSDGTFVTLGVKEVEDLAAVVRYIQQDERISTLGLWGRSMGAVTALLYSNLDPDIAGTVADSPFASFEMLVQDIGRRYLLPPFIVQPTLDSLVQAIKDKTGRNILDASPLALARATTGAVLLGHASKDTLVPKRHSELLKERLNAQSAALGKEPTAELILFKGNHADHSRPKHFMQAGMLHLMQQQVVAEERRQLKLQGKIVQEQQQEPELEQQQQLGKAAVILEKVSMRKGTADGLEQPDTACCSKCCISFMSRYKGAV